MQITANNQNSNDMATFKINVTIEVSENWIEDGEGKNSIAKKLETFLTEEMNPFCYPGEYKMSSIKVDQTK